MSDSLEIFRKRATLETEGKWQLLLAWLSGPVRVFPEPETVLYTNEDGERCVADFCFIKQEGFQVRISLNRWWQQWQSRDSKTTLEEQIAALVVSCFQAGGLLDEETPYGHSEEFIWPCQIAFREHAPEDKEASVYMFLTVAYRNQNAQQEQFHSVQNFVSQINNQWRAFHGIAATPQQESEVGAIPEQRSHPQQLRLF